MGHPGSGHYNPPKSGTTAIIIVAVVVAALGFIFISAILRTIVFPAFLSAREKAQDSACINHMRQLGVAMSAYRADWGDTYPPPGNWNSLLAKYAKDPAVFVCPKARSTKPSYGMNSGLSGITGAGVKYPDATVMFFETEPGENKAGGSALLLSYARHSGTYRINAVPPHGQVGRCVVCFADGRVRMIEQADVHNLNWNPAPKTAPASP